MENVYKVELTRKARRNLNKIPQRITDNFWIWVEDVEMSGVRVARKTKSYHDEPLQGKRFGQRSIRLNQSYRAFYREKNNGVVELIEVLEINKHDY
ncbi:MAG TPA: hypothetical protein VJK30_04655 [Coxiellaceae bacterium]|nr:MAG: hypothetical protein A3E81_00295 [Gammaproteobacteria bacterium RIFCSPHIGHO2_12_FULL_36_30]HLB56601.1 hypothetical protein [Coxiellaceae bacterium]